MERPSTIPESRTLRELPFPETMTVELVERWADTIPRFAENDPTSPEWRATPVRELDLSSEGFGRVLLKDESDAASNPTRTIKDRKAWEFATLYRDFAQSLYVDLRRGHRTIGSIQRMPVPRLSLITAGNEGRAIAACFEKYGLPAPKLVASEHAARAMAEAGIYADVYGTDLDRRTLTAGDIRSLSDNAFGIDITSLVAIDPHATYYDWHVHEVFNLQPDEVYLPYGIGHLRDNYLTWQRRSALSAMRGRLDPRLKADPVQLSHMRVLAAEPDSIDSIADKLVCRYKPFAFLKENDERFGRAFNHTGDASGKFTISDERVRQAFSILRAKGIDTEPSAAAGLALYMDRFEAGLVRDDAKVVVVNTGAGN